MSPELLARFGLNKTADATKIMESFENNDIDLVPDITESIDNSFLSQIVDAENTRLGSVTGWILQKR